MLKNYLKIAWRNLLNQRTYAIINIMGLTLGFVCFLLLNFYVSSEKNYDSAHEQVYRLLQLATDENGTARETATIGPKLGIASKEQFPEIEQVCRMVEMGRLTVGNTPGNRNHEHMTAVGPGFFDLFDFKLLEGTAANVFSQPNGILLPLTLKEKYFGSGPALGKTLKASNTEFIVAGVLQDFPTNTHLDASLILPEQTATTMFQWWNDFTTTNWHRSSFITYFKLRKDADVERLGEKITRLAAENWPTDMTFQSEFFLQPVQDIHLYSHDVEGEINKSKGNIFYVKAFFWIGLIILLVACFNYTGLLNVAFMGRSKEIGVRKVAGASRSQLLGQFFTESLLLTSFAMIFALVILHFPHTWIVKMLGAEFDWSILPASQIIWLGIAGLLISLLSVAYPALLITNLTIVRAFKDKIGIGNAFSFRRMVIVFQFVAAIALIACTLIFYKQVNYLQHKELGFNIDGLVTVDINSGALRNKFESIKQEFGKLPEVQKVTVTSRVPGEWKNFPLVGVIKPGEEAAQIKEMIFIGADQDFLETYDVALMQGNNFTGNPADSSKVLINASTAQQLALSDPVGQWIEIPSVNWSGDNNPLDAPMKAQISGVVADFQFENFREDIKPMVIGFWNNPIHSIDYYTLRIDAQNWGSTLSALQRINDDFDADNPMEYHMLDTQFERFLAADLLRSRLLMFFSGIVIFIACMGLFAMTAFTLRLRTREIGIRKVLGAEMHNIINLIAANFLKMVLVGALFAVPLSWMVMNSWLEEYAYRIKMDWWLFALAALLAMAIAFLTVSFQTIKAALANPVDSLRSE